MLKYHMTAMFLKILSSTQATRTAYRSLGNAVGGKRRATERMPQYYLERINRMLRLSRDYGVPGDGVRLIELGTGWCHWEAITARLFFDFRATLYDVWDNRQMGALRNYLRQLEEALDTLDADAAQLATARRTIGTIKHIETYEEIYEALGFEYVLDPQGQLEAVEKDAYDLVVSGGVFEHIYARDTPVFVRNVGRLLKSGGYSVHSINIRDHLYLYDTTASPKQYLRYSDREWKLRFSNTVQYINRIQRTEWLDLFAKSGLKLVEEDIESVAVDLSRVAAQYRGFGEKDLACGGLYIVHRKMNG